MASLLVLLVDAERPVRILALPGPASRLPSLVSVLGAVGCADAFLLTQLFLCAQVKADAHDCQLLVLQPGHGGALREPQLLGLPPL